MLKESKKLWFFALFFLVYEMTVYLANDMVMPGMLQVTDDFSAQRNAVALSLSLYVLGGSSLQLFLGPIAERIGKRKLLLFGNAMFIISTLCIPFTASIEQFLAARFFQGMGSCFIFIGYALVHELFDDARAVKLTSLLSNAGIFAPLIGPVVGSAIVSRFHWQYVFVVTLLMAASSLLGLYRFMPSDRDSKGQADVSAIKNSYLKIFGNRRFMRGILIAALSIIPLTAWIGLSPVIVMDSMKQSYDIYILYQFIVFIGFILSTLAVQKLAGRMPLESLIRIGAWISVAGISGLGMAYRHPEAFIFGMFIYSMGFGLFNGGLTRLAMTSTGESMSLASSAMSLLYCIYIAIGMEAYNAVCDAFSYSLFSYALVNIPLGVAVFVMLMRFIRAGEPEKIDAAVSVSVQG